MLEKSIISSQTRRIDENSLFCFPEGIKTVKMIMTSCCVVLDTGIKSLNFLNKPHCKNCNKSKMSRDIEKKKEKVNEFSM